MSRATLGAASLAVLLVIDALAFHDLTEPHTLRDWLTLLATILVLAYLVVDIRRR